MGLRRVTAFVLAGALFVAACGDSKEGGQTSTTTPGADVAPTTEKSSPVKGGTITMGMFSETAGLDPIVSTGSGVTGAIEMLAIYDSVMRWDPETGKYEPRTAESLTSTDLTVWTLKIKPNIKFSDGTDYDADAVMFSLNRHRSGLAGAPACEELRACPRNVTSSAGYMANVKSMAVLDKLTLEITLTEPWGEFPFVLSDEPGMVPSPTALKAVCAADKTKAPRDCTFNLTPIGAGPFLIDRFVPRESITMTRNDKYWGGDVYLDGLKFVDGRDSGSSGTYEAFKAGSFQMAFLRDPKAIATSRADKMPGYSAVQHGGAGMLMNTGLKVNCAAGAPAPTCVGKPDGALDTNPPTKSLTVRKAIAAAVDPKIIDQRAYDGLGRPGSELFHKDFRFYPGVAGPVYNPDEAKRLVTQAKAEGWNGKIRYLCNNSPAGQARGLAMESMLRLAGMDVEVDVTKNLSAQVNQYIVLRDFDLTCAGFNMASDGNAFAQISQQFTPGGASNRTGWNNAKVGDAIKAYKTAKNDAERTAAAKIIAEEYVKDVPFLVEGSLEEVIVSNPKVKGAVFTSGTALYFDKVYVEK